MKNQYKFLAIILSAGMLTACSSDEPVVTNLPKGQYPLKVSATVDTPQSRSAGKDSWTGDGTETFGVRIGTNERAAKYVITNATGDAEAASGLSPLYWDNTDKATVTAWLPYEAQTDVDISDQSVGFAAFDYLTASADGQSYLAPVSLQFTHKMAKIRCILKPGKGITETDLSKAVVKIGGYGSVTFNEGTLSGSGFGWITPTDDGEALLVPQNMTGKEFITIEMGGEEYVYTPADDNAGLLKEGLLHQYTVTINANGIEVSTATGGSWTDGGSEDVPSIDVLETFTAGQLKVGDFVYADGSFSDGGLRCRLADGTFMVKDVTPAPDKTPVGVVFHLRDGSSPEDECDYAEFSGQTPTGYIVSIDQGRTAFMSGFNYEDDNQTPNDNINGYKYTNVYYEKYHEVFSLYAIEWCKGHTTVTATESASFSSWYVPSTKELMLMRGESNGNTPVYDILKQNVLKAKGDAFINEDYFTCQFFGMYGMYLWTLNLSTGERPGRDFGTVRSYRAVCAFHKN